jgi:hypothetical protein
MLPDKLRKENMDMATGMERREIMATTKKL